MENIIHKIIFYKTEFTQNQNYSVNIIKKIFQKLSNGRPILQLEQSIGDVIRNFPGRALAVNVSRRRFLPVKSTRDLFHLRSKCLFSFNSSLCLLQKIGESPLPEVILSTEEFGALTDFEKRIPEIPKIQSNVEKIVITGNVFLGKGIQFNVSLFLLL